MAIRDLLVYVEGSNDDQKRLDLAVRLAGAGNGHVIGLHVTPPANLPPYMAMAVDAKFIQLQQERLNEQAAEAEATFRAAMDKSGLKGEWRREQGDPGKVITRHARYVDVVVLGQENPDELSGSDTLLIETVLLDSGRPVLVAPYIGVPEQVGRRILVGWNGSREATRAVHDALGLLVGAEQVDVLVCNPDDTEAASDGIPAADICTHLARHGVRAEAQHLPAEDLQVGDALLSRASDLGSDMIVMGGYGHSRLREMVLGGATRHILKHMTVPTLFSH